VIYVDESIQSNHGYICTAFVYATEPVDADVAAALSRAGLTPGHDEFKSGARMAGRTELQLLRRDLLSVVQSKTRIGLLITAEERRPELGLEICKALRQLVHANGLSGSQDIYIDQGIGVPINDDHEWLEDRGAIFHLQCDSKTVLGIQLADHVAYHCSYVLLEKLLGPKKHVRVGEESGFIDPFDAELGWVFWTDLRHNFFMEHKEWDDRPGDWYFGRDLLGYGAFISNHLPDELRETAGEVFSFVWIGCIH